MNPPGCPALRVRLAYKPHRVFPAKGAPAGTALRMERAYFFLGYARMSGSATVRMSAAERRKDALDGGVVIGPGVLEFVRKLFYLRGAAWSKDEETGCGG